MDLSDVRKNIDRVDGEIRRLFVERMTEAGVSKRIYSIDQENYGSKP